MTTTARDMTARARAQFKEGRRYVEWAGTTHRLTPWGTTFCGLRPRLQQRRTASIAYYDAGPFRHGCRRCSAAS